MKRCTEVCELHALCMMKKALCTSSTIITVEQLSYGWLVMGYSTHAATVKVSIIITNLNVSMKANTQFQQQQKR